MRLRSMPPKATTSTALTIPKCSFAPDRALKLRPSSLARRRKACLLARSSRPDRARSTRRSGTARSGKGTQLRRLAHGGHIEVGNSDGWHDSPVDPVAPFPAERLLGGANLTEPAE